MNRALLRIPRTSILDYLEGRKDLVLPEGAKLASAWIDSRERLVLAIEHPSFPDIAGGCRIPRIKARFKERVPQ